MVLDNQSIFSDSQAITGGTALIASTNILDLGAPGKTGYSTAQLVRRMSQGNTPLLIQAVEDIDVATTITVSIQTDSVEAFSSATNVATVDIAVADLNKAGYVFPWDKLPRGINERYLRLAYTPNGIATTGKLTAGIVAAVDGCYRGNA